MLIANAHFRLDGNTGLPGVVTAAPTECHFNVLRCHLNDGHDHHDEEEKDEMKEMNKGEDTDMICTTYTVYTIQPQRVASMYCGVI